MKVQTSVVVRSAALLFKFKVSVTFDLLTSNQLGSSACHDKPAYQVLGPWSETERTDRQQMVQLQYDAFRGLKNSHYISFVSFSMYHTYHKTAYSRFVYFQNVLWNGSCGERVGCLEAPAQAIKGALNDLFPCYLLHAV